MPPPRCENLGALHEAIKSNLGAETRFLVVPVRSPVPLGRALGANHLRQTEGILRGVAMENPFECAKVYRRKIMEPLPVIRYSSADVMIQETPEEKGKTDGPYPECLHSLSRSVQRGLKERIAFAIEPDVDVTCWCGVYYFFRISEWRRSGSGISPILWSRRARFTHISIAPRFTHC